MQKLLRLPVRVESGEPVIGKNSTTFSIADPVYRDTNGFLTTCAIGAPILGYAMEDKTTTSNNQTVTKYKPIYIPALDVRLAMTADGTITDAILSGAQYKNFGTVTSGSFQIALAVTGAGGQVKLLGKDPYGADDDTIAECVASELQNLAYAQA